MLQTTKSPPRSTRRTSSKTAEVEILSTCPVNGAGWCPYPFSPAQLAKRLKLKAEAQAAKPEATTSGKRRRLATH